MPSARTIARLITTARDHLTKPKLFLVAAVERSVPDLVEERRLMDRFHAMIRTRGNDLERWIEDTSASLVASFASGVCTDKAAIAAAIEEPWSNGAG